MNQGDKQKKPVTSSSNSTNATSSNPPKRMSTGTNHNLKPYVEVKLVTWNKDSHGLFDYESKSVDLKFIKIETPCEIYRLKKDPAPDGSKEKEEFRILDSPVGTINKENLNNKNSVFLAGVDEVGQRVGSSQFQFNAFKDSLNTLAENQQAQESYLIVRSLKNQSNVQKGYELKIGDIVKFGRIEYQVIQLKNAKGDAAIRNISKQIHIQEEMMAIESQPRLCKICLGEDECDENFFCNPCDCKGSCEYVHFECLKNWIQSKVKQKKADNTIVYSWKKSDCELCKKALPKHVQYQNKLNDLLDIEIPEEKPYIILESIAKEKKVVKTLFLFSTNIEDTEIKLGRGHQCEVRISDISVSRTHSMIRYKDGKFTIFDNNSKFGTLIKINENLDITSDKKAVQIGRTVITFAQKMGVLNGGNQFQERTEVQRVGHPHHHHQHHHPQNYPNGGGSNNAIGPQSIPIQPNQIPNGGVANQNPVGSQQNINTNYINQFPHGQQQYNFIQPIQAYSQQINSNALNAQVFMQQQHQANVAQLGNQVPPLLNAQILQNPAQFPQQFNYQFQNGNDQGLNSKQNKGNNRQQ